MKLKNMIIKITFPHGVMMFGNSYKSWNEQVEEYMRRNAEELGRPSRAEKSNSKFIAWGGLKWCSEENFQQLLNREGCQYDELDNPNPRLYSDMLFEDADAKTFEIIVDLWKQGQKLMKVNKLNDREYALYEKGKLEIIIE